jgi:hypothetical protein
MHRFFIVGWALAHAENSWYDYADFITDFYLGNI